MALPKCAQLAPKAIIAHAKCSAQIDDCVASQIEADGLGLALAIVVSGAVVHAAGYGLADVREGIPAAQDTMFQLASGGKQLTGLGFRCLPKNASLISTIQSASGFCTSSVVGRITSSIRTGEMQVGLFGRLRGGASHAARQMGQ